VCESNGESNGESSGLLSVRLRLQVVFPESRLPHVTQTCLFTKSIYGFYMILWRFKDHLSKLEIQIESNSTLHTVKNLTVLLNDVCEMSEILSS